MSYQVLARKWRPKNFTDVVGQKHVLIGLINSLSLGRIHHAYLFSGTRGIGKTSIARLLAKGLNCETGVTATPCGMCDNCHEIELGCFVDLIESDAASRTKVEDTRDLLDNVQYSPVRGRFKVYLIDEVHMLSRHSFNALLKTLEEPPEHVKFLLATTEPQKLPVTVLSRCLQFHLKVLDVKQIRDRLEQILNSEDIVYELHALQQLARAANGSLRDALSLTDQAIVSGNGKLTAETVSVMLGTLDNNQTLSIIEAIIDANGKRALSLVNEVAARGIDWETLLVEMMVLLHRLAMLQLSSLSSINDTDTTGPIEQRLRKLACTVPPSEVQFYYETMLIGRKELPFAPDRRIGVEMTMLRALAFHQRVLLPKTEEQPAAQSVTSITHPMLMIPSQMLPPTKLEKSLSTITSLIIAARSQLQYKKDCTGTLEENKLIASPLEVRSPRNTDLKQLTPVIECAPLTLPPPAFEQKTITKKRTHPRKSATLNNELMVNVNTPKVFNEASEYVKSPPELPEWIIKEAIARDTWSEEINQLKLPKLVEQVALNSWREQKGNQIYLHLRPSHWHLNSSDTQKTLAEALAIFQGNAVELTIINDNNYAIHTPLEWRQIIYNEKLSQLRIDIIADANIQTIIQFFDAILDEESICLL